MDDVIPISANESASDEDTLDLMRGSNSRTNTLRTRRKALDNSLSEEEKARSCALDAEIMGILNEKSQNGYLASRRNIKGMLPEGTMDFCMPSDVDEDTSIPDSMRSAAPGARRSQSNVGIIRRPLGSNPYTKWATLSPCFVPTPDIPVVHGNDPRWPVIHGVKRAVISELKYRGGTSGALSIQNSACHIADSVVHDLEAILDKLNSVSRYVCAKHSPRIPILN
jgi:hypothetical protein